MHLLWSKVNLKFNIRTLNSFRDIFHNIDLETIIQTKKVKLGQSCAFIWPTKSRLESFKILVFLEISGKTEKLGKSFLFISGIIWKLIYICSLPLLSDCLLGIVIRHFINVVKHHQGYFLLCAPYWNFR